MICATENSAVIDTEIYDEVKAQLVKNGVYFVPKNEHQKLSDAMFDPKRGSVRGPIAGKSAKGIAKLAGIKVPANTKVLAAEITGVGPKHPLSAEKLSPVISVYRAKTQQDAFDICEKLLNFGGLGHTAGIQTLDDDVALKFGIKMKAARVLVNTPVALVGLVTCTTK